MEMENKERKKFAEILDSQYMSSEESEEEDALKIRPLPWLSTAAITSLRKRWMKKGKAVKQSIKERQKGTYVAK